MTKTHLLTLALVAGLSLPTLAHAGGFGNIFTPETRTESSSIDIGSVFHTTDDSSPVDIKDVFHTTDNSDLPIKIYDIPGKGDIGLVIPPSGTVGTVKVGSGKAGSGPSSQTTQTASARDDFMAKFDCVVAGTPSEFPNDLRITNAGPTTIPVGTRIKWQTKAPRLTGAAVLSAPLKAGKAVSLSGVLAGGLEAGTPCSVKAIGL